MTCISIPTDDANNRHGDEQVGNVSQFLRCSLLFAGRAHTNEPPAEVGGERTTSGASSPPSFDPGSLARNPIAPWQPVTVLLSAGLLAYALAMPAHMQRAFFFGPSPHEPRVTGQGATTIGRIWMRRKNTKTDDGFYTWASVGKNSGVRVNGSIRRQPLPISTGPEYKGSS